MTRKSKRNRSPSLPLVKTKPNPDSGTFLTPQPPLKKARISNDSKLSSSARKKAITHEEPQSEKEDPDDEDASFSSSSSIDGESPNTIVERKSQSGFRAKRPQIAESMLSMLAQATNTDIDQIREFFNAPSRGHPLRNDIDIQDDDPKTDKSNREDMVSRIERTWEGVVEDWEEVNQEEDNHGELEIKAEQLKIWGDRQEALAMFTGDHWDKTIAFVGHRKVKMQEILKKIHDIDGNRRKLLDKAKEDFEEALKRQSDELEGFKQELKKGREKYRAKLLKATDKDRINKEVNMTVAKLLAQN
ncbi:uncharacterized protein IL334_002735 [Kwoniella shivajii]|uniref:Uncharacterized protein n=1 Tax=Kwoniella shivajii TaxID=564305 RepID=A0ABZ1CVJ4_9TREE|nr:hypothetical protein IL334_002735 [Kwoniella shivajii]